MSYVVPELVQKEDFNEFLLGHFRDAVLEFNGACGKGVNAPENVQQASIAIINECKRVIEECNETIKAYTERDRKERLDGIVDVYWTQTQLTALFKGFADRFGAGELAKALDELDHDERLLMEYARSIVPMALTLGIGNIISGKSIIISALRVIENNRKKYTTCPDTAKDWEEKIPEECKGKHVIKSYEHEGTTYYCIKRLSDDYIVKPYNFKPVELGGL